MWVVFIAPPRQKGFNLSLLWNQILPIPYLLQFSNYFRLGLDQIRSFFSEFKSYWSPNSFFFGGVSPDPVAARTVAWSLGQKGWPKRRRETARGSEGCRCFFSSPEFGIQNGGWRWIIRLPNIHVLLLSGFGINCGGNRSCHHQLRWGLGGAARVPASSSRVRRLEFLLGLDVLIRRFPLSWGYPIYHPWRIFRRFSKEALNHLGISHWIWVSPLFPSGSTRSRTSAPAFWASPWSFSSSWRSAAAAPFARPLPRRAVNIGGSDVDAHTCKDIRYIVIPK